MCFTRCKPNTRGKNPAMPAKMPKLLAAQGGRIDAIFYCPHTSDDECHCRKPQPGLFEQMQDGDVVVLTADHGCDPTWGGTDHTREYIPVLFFGKPVKAGSVGRRETFADIGQSIAAYHGLPKLAYGTSFL